MPSAGPRLRRSNLYIGLISGTSMDAVDAVLLDLAQADTPRLAATHAEPPEASLRDDLLALSQDVAGVSLAKLGELDQRVGHWFADAALKLLEHAGTRPDAVRGIGSHGQTVHHAPDAPYPFSMQLGEPSVIAARTGIATVAHPRGADIAAGGQGAPLVPAFHHRVFRHAGENRAILNLGGIANLTLLPATADEDDTRVLGFDTGPGNALLDTWAAEHLGDPQDTDGRWATTGRVHEDLLNLMLQEPYFQKSPPKSTGREYFHLAWLRGQLASLEGLPNPADVQRTLCELTALSVATALDEYGPGDERVLLCGGGARNPVLRERLEALLAPRAIAETGDYGVPADWVEAAALAWLAMRTLTGLPGNLPSVTGAREAVVLGGIYDPKGVRREA